MQTKTDAQLLREYASTGSETAFGELVSRHADLVYSAALRHVIDPDSARDLAQRVFADLARKAKSLSGKAAVEPQIDADERRYRINDGGGVQPPGDDESATKTFGEIILSAFIRGFHAWKRSAVNR